MKPIYWGMFGFFLFMSLMTYLSYMAGGPINLVLLALLGCGVSLYAATK